MNKTRIILSSIIGNALEFYDFTLYGVFTVVLAQHFFPSSNPSLSIMASWAAFAVGFFMRPVGAAIFGHFGDKYGRKGALTFSVVMMGIPTFIIGCLPSYHSIGIWAPIGLIVCRLLQGLCTGGEYNGAAIFALEHLKKHPGLAGGFITGSCVVGALAATGIGALFNKPEMPDYLWRLAFCLGALVSLLGFYVRRKVSETPEFLAYLETKKPTIKTMPLLRVARKHLQAILMTLLSGGLNGALSYTLFGFMNFYLYKYKGIPMAEAMRLNLIGLFTFMLASPLMGRVYDTVKNGTYFLYASFIVIGMAFPIFFLFQQDGLLALLLAQISLGFLTGTIAGPQHAYLQTLFPVEARYSGIAFGFCTGMAIGGGCAPAIMTRLIEDTSNMYVPAFYISSIAVLFFTALYITQIRSQKIQVVA